jgi:hypothetical protein
MLGMYYFYRNSPAQRKKLKKTFKVSENNIAPDFTPGILVGFALHNL